MNELSVFIDESGVQEGKTDYYLVTLVFHNQNDSISSSINSYESALQQAGLPNIPFHLTPLLRAHTPYHHLDLGDRKRLLSYFARFVRIIPIRYDTLTYPSTRFNTASDLSLLIRRDLVRLLSGDDYSYFLSFDSIKIFYDGGQAAVSKAVRDTCETLFARPVFPQLSYRDYRLAQVADYICGMEFTALKYRDNKLTATDEKFFGTIGNFRKNHLRKLQQKRIKH